MQLLSTTNFDQETLLDLESQASESYNRFTYRDYEEFDIIHRFLIVRGWCEFCAPFGRVVVDEGAWLQ